MKTKKRVFKVYLAWQDERESAWLRHMANKGWHFTSYTFCVYTFVKGEPSDVVYQLDFNNDIKNDHDSYVELFRADGWELVDTFGSWHYFRKPCSAGGNMHIYTDRDSQIKKYQKILFFLAFMGMYSIYSSIHWWILSFGDKPEYMQSMFFTILRLFVTGAAVLMLACIIMLILRIRGLKKQDTLSEK